MYLSRLALNLRNRRVQRELAEPYQMHRSIMRAFPDGLQPGDERVLWRVDEHATLGLVLLVQSWGVPDWSCLAEDSFRGYLRPLDEPNPAMKPFSLSVTAGQVLAFRLRANPTVKRHFSDSGDHKRVGIYAEDEQIEWLQRKGEASGFQVLSVRTATEGHVRGSIRRHDDAHNLNLFAVRFDGVLQVIAPTHLQDGVKRGIGSAKGLGFGLLSLAPAR